MHRAARLLALWLLTLTCVRAHPVLENPVWIESSPDRVTVTLHVSVRELIVVQGLPVTTDGKVDPLEAEDIAPKHSGYILDHWQIKADGEPVTGTVTAIKPPASISQGEEGPDRAHFVWTLEYPLPRPPKTLTFSQNMCVEFPSAPGVPWDLSYACRYGPHNETPRKFIRMVRDTPLTFTTGFILVREPMTATVLGLWIVFIAASVLGRTSALPSPFPYTGPVVVFGAGVLTTSLLPEWVPLWLLYLLAGAASIFTAVDTIYSAAAGPRRYRLALLYTGALIFGAIFAQQYHDFPALDRLWHLAPLPAAMVAVLIGAGVLFAVRGRAARIQVLFVQIAALICCLDAAWLMLKLLEVHT
jgi:hypothetical protein